MQGPVADDFYEKIKHRLYERIGKELSMARYVLDLGCGDCALAQFLRKTSGQRVVGVDISDGSFPRHDEPGKGSRSSLKCIKADANQLEFLRDGAIDAAVTTWALHEMEEPEGTLREALGILRPGGEILVVDFPRGSLAQQLWNEKYFSPAEIAGMLRQAGFVKVRARTIERQQVTWATGIRPSTRDCVE